MLKQIVFFRIISIFLLLVSLPVHAQEETPTLSSSLLNNDTKINLTLNSQSEDTTCQIKLYVAGQRKKLKRQKSRFLLAEFSNKGGPFDIQIPDIKKIKRGKTNSRRKRMFFRYALECPNTRATLSKFTSVTIKRTKRRAAVGIRKWLKQVQNESINSAYTIEQAFPSLDFTFPVDMKHAGDGSGRLFVVQKRGKVMVFENDPTVTEASTFLDIEDRVKATHEEGLLGLAFHPDFSENGYFYLYYTETDSGDSIVSRFTASDPNSNEADPDSELELIRLEQPSPVHQAGCMHFGADGLLYIAFGDGGAANDPNEYGQDFSNIYGTIVRIDVDATDQGNYGIPASNPFVGVSGADERIYAYGFRNPWRFSFDSETNELWLGDVGQGSYEEIDIVEAGKNYGWDTMEGMHCFEEEESSDCDQTGLTLPIYEYSHEEGFSITGGSVYRGSAIPTLVGKYIYADYTVGKIWSLEQNEEEEYENTLILDTELYFSSFGVDEDNELYVLGYGDGKVYKFGTLE